MEITGLVRVFRGDARRWRTVHSPPASPEVDCGGPHAQKVTHNRAREPKTSTNTELGDTRTIYHPRDTNFQGEDLPEGPTHPIDVVRPEY